MVVNWKFWKKSLLSLSLSLRSWMSVLSISKIFQKFKNFEFLRLPWKITTFFDSVWKCVWIPPIFYMIMNGEGIFGGGIKIWVISISSSLSVENCVSSFKSVFKKKQKKIEDFLWFCVWSFTWKMKNSKFGENLKLNLSKTNLEVRKRECVSENGQQ